MSQVLRRESVRLVSRKLKINRTVGAVAGHCWVSEALNQMIGVISCVPPGQRFISSELLFLCLMNVANPV